MSTAMIKYIGIFILSASLSVYGAAISSSVKKTNLIRKEIILLLRSFERNILYGNKTYSEVLAQCPLPLLTECGFFNVIEKGNLEHQINKSLCIFSDEDRKMLKEYFSSFGKAQSREEELKLCRYCLDYFEKTQQTCEKSIDTRVLLYKRLGLMAGILSVIIFI